jgi:hypothetical protein
MTSESREPSIRETATIVIAGLDPAIHLFNKTLAKNDGCAGQAATSAGMTSQQLMPLV